jgi:DUF4097 and DUF4098 domain-containing protein YvlB
MFTSRTLIRGVVGALLVPLVGLQAQVDRQRIDTSFTFDRGGRVQLGIVSGEIRVVAGTTDQIRIVASTERGRLESSLSRGRVSIEARSVGGRLGATRYELTVPVGTEVHANSISGDISIRGTKAQVEASSISGDVRVEDATDGSDFGSISGRLELTGVSGRTEVSTVSADIRIDGISGDLKVSGVSAEISIRRGTLNRLRAETVSGDITYDGTFAPDGDYQFNAHSGEILFSIPSNGGAALELETWSGDISTDFPLTLQPGEGVGRRNRRMQFTIGSGGARISAETFSGDITIRRVAARPQE